MPLLARTIMAPLHIDVRRGAVADLGGILADGRISAGGDVAVVVGPGQGEKIAELIRPRLGSADVYTAAGGTLDVWVSAVPPMCPTSPPYVAQPTAASPS